MRGYDQSVTAGDSVAIVRAEYRLHLPRLKRLMFVLNEDSDQASEYTAAGADDDRHLWPEMCRVIAELRPAWVVGENVAGIIRMELDQVQKSGKLVVGAAAVLTILTLLVATR